MSRRSFVRDGDQFVPRVLFEPPGLGPYSCKICRDTSVLIERIDEERHDVLVPCWSCRRYCKPCDKYVPKEGHACPAKENHEP